MECIRKSVFFLVDLVMVRENTEGLYHSLQEDGTICYGERDEKLVIEKFLKLEGEVKWEARPISEPGGANP